MTSLLSMLDRFEQAAVTYETSDDRADRDELHAARRAILEAFEGLTKDRDHWHAYSSGQGKLIESGVFVKNEEYVALVEREAELVKALEAKQAAFHRRGEKIIDMSEREAELVRALGRAERAISYPVSSEIKKRGFDVRTDDDSLSFAVETIRTALHPKPKSAE